MEAGKIIDEYIDQLSLIANSKINEKMSIEAKGLGLILAYLYRNIDSVVYSGDISRVLCISTARVAQAIKTLESSNYVIRIIDENDARKTIVKLTDSGVDRVLAQRKKIELFMSKLIEDVGEEELKTFVNLFKNINEASIRIIKEMNNNV